MDNVRELANIPRYVLVHGFGKTKHPGDGIWYAADQVRPWCVYFAFAGHYFQTVDQALQYAALRGFIHTDMIGKIKANLTERGYVHNENLY